jgi:hypothetical protein
MADTDVLLAWAEHSDRDRWLQETLRARYEADKTQLSLAEKMWVVFDKADRGWDEPTTRRAWLKVVKEHGYDGYGGGIRMKKRRSTHKKKKKKPSKKYRSRKHKHTKRR